MKLIIIHILAFLMALPGIVTAQLCAGEVKSDIQAMLKEDGFHFVSRKSLNNGFYMLTYQNEDQMKYLTFSNLDICVLSIETENFNEAYYHEICKLIDKHYTRYAPREPVWILQGSDDERYICAVNGYNGMMVTATMRQQDFISYYASLNKNTSFQVSNFTPIYSPSSSSQTCNYCKGTGNCDFCTFSGQSLACVRPPYGVECTDKYCIAKNHECKQCGGTHRCSYCKGTGKR
jgi:hypothetical protein